MRVTGCRVRAGHESGRGNLVAASGRWSTSPPPWTGLVRCQAQAEKIVPAVMIGSARTRRRIDS